MSRLRQMPVLFGVRGSIATQTMSNLTKEQIEQVNQIVCEVSKDQNLDKQRCKFIQKLGNTIGGDYRSDRSVAEHEFNIAVWRATIHLLFHREYSYICVFCNATEYRTATTGRIKKFDRQHPICPNCSKTVYRGRTMKLRQQASHYVLVDPETGEVLKSPGRRVDIEKAVISPIRTIFGKKKVENPQEILSDPVQRQKWYTTWVWNYFRQVLLENTIKTHNKRQTVISGPPQLMATREIENILKQAKQKYYIDESSTYGREIEIFVCIWEIPADFNRAMDLIRLAYHAYGVDIILSQFSVKIIARKDAATIVQTTITTEDPVIILSLDAPDNNNDDNSSGWSDLLAANKIETDPDSESVGELTNNDWIDDVGRAIPDEICRRMFDIYTQRNGDWNKFSKRFGDRAAAKTHLAKYFGITPEEVEGHRRRIMQIYLERKLELDGDDTDYAIESGDLAILTPNNHSMIAHFNSDCSRMNGFVGNFRVARVLRTMCDFVKVRSCRQLVKICPKCTPKKALSEISS